MPTAFDVLASDHEQVEQLLAKFETAPAAAGANDSLLASRKKMAETLVIEVSKHEAIEEMYFWPAVRKLLPDGDELADQSGHGLGPRTTKDLVEEQLFTLRNNLFSELSLVFLDTTSLYFEGEGGQSLGQYGHSKDHRPDLKQVVLAVVIDGSGRPICSELWPGNTTDVTTLLPGSSASKTAS